MPEIRKNKIRGNDRNLMKYFSKIHKLWSLESRSPISSLESPSQTFWLSLGFGFDVWTKSQSRSQLHLHEYNTDRLRDNPQNYLPESCKYKLNKTVFLHMFHLDRAIHTGHHIKFAFLRCLVLFYFWQTYSFRNAFTPNLLAKSFGDVSPYVFAVVTYSAWRLYK